MLARLGLSYVSRLSRNVLKINFFSQILVQVALVIRGLSICGFTYSRLNKLVPKLAIRGPYPRLFAVFDGLLVKIRNKMTHKYSVP